jgi:hypothetical protein
MTTLTRIGTKALRPLAWPRGCRISPPSCSWFAKAIPRRSRTGPTLRTR